MGAKAPRPPTNRQTAWDKAQESKVSIALRRPCWLAIREACRTALAKPEARWAFVSGFLARLDETLKSYKPPKINEPGNLGNWSDPEAIPIEGRICNWVSLAELILTFGDPEARSGAAVIIPATSQVLFGANEVPE